MDEGRVRSRGGQGLIAMLGALIAALAVLMTAGSPATAASPAGATVGTGSATVWVYLHGGDVTGTLDALAVTLERDGPSATCTPNLTDDGGFDGYVRFDCTGVALNTIYTVAYSGATGYQELTSPATGCDDSLDLTLILQEPQENERCRIWLGTPTVLIDKQIGPLNGIAESISATEFTLEVYDEGGSLVEQANDPSSNLCFGQVTVDDCAVVELPAGDYQLGEAPLPGYVPTSVWCAPLREDGEVFPAGVGEFSVSLENTATVVTYCRIVNEQFGASLDVDKVVVNDDGGTATADDFTAEVYFEASGSLEFSGACAADGTCISSTIPVGEYRIGETGPDGYEATVSCAVDSEPDPPSIDTSVPFLQPFAEAIPGDSALILLEAFGGYSCTITNDDIATTTTTTTTTIAATTTTPTPTSSIPVILPPTGAGDSTWSMALVAFGSVALGLLLLRLRRTA